MKKEQYWHLQMHMPEGRDGTYISSLLMLQEQQPVIGTGDWDHIQCDDFKGANGKGMSIGDIVLLREGQKPIALCRVLGECYQNADLEEKYLNKNYRNVYVLEDYTSCNMPLFPMSQGTLAILSSKTTTSWKYIDNLYNKAVNNMNIQQIKDILLEKKQIILQGAPGTGKTYSTAALALSIIGESYDPTSHKDIMEKYRQLVETKRIFFTTFHQSMDYEDFVEGLRPEIVDGNVSYSVKDGIFKIACGYAEEKDSMTDIDNAIEKLKEKCSEETLVLKTTTGVEFSLSYRGGRTFRVRSSKSQTEEGRDFPVNINNIKEYHKNNAIKAYNKSYVRGIYQNLTNTSNIKPYNDKTVKEKQQNYVLIIDEINRGNISKILGELITLLECDKRQGGTHTIPAILPYSNESFTVPSNLYIIGTMNTTDRSVGHIDYAVRRRFAFYTLKADKRAIESYYLHNSITNGTKEIAEDLFDKVNALISTKKSAELDAEDLMVGHSYFMAETIDKLKMKLEYEIIPLLREYEKDGILSINIEDLRKQEVEWKNLFINKV